MFIPLFGMGYENMFGLGMPLVLSYFEYLISRRWLMCKLKKNYF
jgi:hypothetical protein